MKKNEKISSEQCAADTKAEDDCQQAVINTAIKISRMILEQENLPAKK